MNQLDELLILTSEEIDFDTLSEEILEQLALSDDPFIATEALGELQGRESDRTISVAWSLLMNPNSDRYLQATCIETLLEQDCDRTIDYLVKELAKLSPYVINCIVEFLLESNLEINPEKLLTLVEIVNYRIKQMAWDSSSNNEVILELAQHFKKLEQKLNARKIDLSNKILSAPNNL